MPNLRRLSNNKHLRLLLMKRYRIRPNQRMWFKNRGLLVLPHYNKQTQNNQKLQLRARSLRRYSLLNKRKLKHQSRLKLRQRNQSKLRHLYLIGISLGKQLLSKSKNQFKLKHLKHYLLRLLQQIDKLPLNF
jgi:hypothetical protein